MATMTLDTVNPDTVNPDTVTLDTVTPDTVTLDTVTLDTVTLDSVTLDSVTLHTDAPDPHAPDTGAPDPQLLLAAARTGDELAWAELTRRYGGLVHSVSRRQGITGAETADIAQTTWLRLLTHLDDIHTPRGLGSWLATTATRECHAHRRRHGREAPVDGTRLEGRLRVNPQEELVEALDQARRSRLLRESLAELPDRQRALIEILLNEESLSYVEIAERLDMPVGAIGPVRQRALRRLRTLLEAKGCTGTAR